jgi:L-proline amide hydrolase
MRDGFVEWDGHRTWFGLEGELQAGGPTPLVILHGGPGAAHDYLEPIGDLATTAGRPCVFYDQIGCGRSEHLASAPADFWTVDLFARELRAVVAKLGIDGGYHVLGQSWGGMLGMEHALGRPAGLRSLVLANAPASMQMRITETNRLRGMLPAEVQEVLSNHEAAGTTDSDEYQQAVRRFYERHRCRIPFPDCLQRTFAQIARDPTVYRAMNGPSEFQSIGSLRDWNITPRLHDVRVPALVISGQHDEATPNVVRPLARALPVARWELIGEASHTPHLEQPERFLGLVEPFLASHDC